MSSRPITLMLRELAAGDKSALDRLLPLVYSELRKLAGSYLRRERTGHTLQPTALVHEAYIKLIGQDDQPDYQSRVHFMMVAAHLMRQILTDHARARNTGKRGGGIPKLPLDAAVQKPTWSATAREPAVLTVDAALDTLALHNPLRSKLIEFRFFGGMTAEESAEALNLPVEKVRAELRVAQAWLHRELKK